MVELTCTNPILVIYFSQSGLTQKLATLKQELDWLERMDVTCSATPPTAKEGEEGEQNRLDINNNFKREMLL